MFQVAQAVAVVTGAASGIGAALARRIATEGAAAVVVADVDADRAAAVASQLPGAVGVVDSFDAGDEAQVAEAVTRIQARVGPIDLWCSNAGVASQTGLGSDEDWLRCWRLHVMAHVYAGRHVVPAMVARGRGHVMVTASAAGLLSEADTAPYAVTKHGSVAIAEWLAIQYGDRGVSFSCLCPQGVSTPMLAGAGQDAATLRAGAVISAEQVADEVIAAWAEGRFLILPHPEVAEYERRRATDRDRWLAAMRRLRSA